VPELDARREDFEAAGATVIDVSTDSIPSHIAWQKTDIGAMHIPMCADFYPHGAVAQAFGIFREGPPLPGISERAAFVVDKHGRIAFAKVYPLDQTPDVKELLRMVQSLP
jgi:alkyl hydroperoxide reductase subunit AhpC